jgi:uridylate kinase
MAKNGVDGVYTDDPKTNPSASLIPNLTFKEIEEQGLRVMDKEAAQFLQDLDVEVVVFNMDKISQLSEILSDDNQPKTVITK